MPLDPATCWVFIPIIAIAMVLGSKMLSMVLSHREQMASIRGSRSVTTHPDLMAELQQLRTDMARLRDTTTQYDMSIQHTLEQVQIRIAALEAEKPSSWNHAFAGSLPKEPVEPVQLTRNNG
jgi:hypothetical protein